MKQWNGRDRILALFLSICMLFLVPGMELRVQAETELPMDLYVGIIGGDVYLSRAMNYAYDHNRYISVVDLQKALVGTEKEFKLSIKDSRMDIIFTKDEEMLSPESIEGIDAKEASAFERGLQGWTAEEKENFTNKESSYHRLTVNGADRKYQTIFMKVGGITDCYMAICDFCMMMDLYGYFEGDALQLDPSSPFAVISPVELETDGYFQGVNSVLVGDTTTGEIFYGYHEDTAFPIASTTKLMTYLLVAEAIEKGEITQETLIPVSKEAVALSKTSDGVIPLKEGKSYSVFECTLAALVSSSNECDLMLSECVAGDEENAVQRMNEKARELSMASAEFYTCNGLPIYTKSFVPAKKQNRMSSSDMFRLSAHILNHYPQVKDYTSIQRVQLEGMQVELKNTNPVLYNLADVTGLKTGTTNKSGACLVTSITATDGYVDHDVVVVLFGAEGSLDRGRVSELLARYGKAVVEGRADRVENTGESVEGPGLHANEIVNMIVNRAMMQKKENE